MKNILSVDVEELFHTEYVRNLRMNNAFYRTPDNIREILEFLDEYNVKATFFIVGEIAEKFPSVLREINKRGHEVAFHSYDHKPLWEKNREKLRIEIESFNKLLALITGIRCIGFRAPSFSLNKKTVWALEVLEETGMIYDSSIFPTQTPLYGISHAPIKPYKPSNGNLTVEKLNGKLWEFPLAVYSFFGLRIPAAGGFYLRFIPSFVRRAVKKMNDLGFPAVIYVHNWELDHDLPRLRLNPYKSFVTYHNIEKTVNLVKCLLRDFEFTSFAKHIEEVEMV